MGSFDNAAAKSQVAGKASEQSPYKNQLLGIYDSHKHKGQQNYQSVDKNLTNKQPSKQGAAAPPNLTV